MMKKLQIIVEKKKVKSTNNFQQWFPAQATGNRTDLRNWTLSELPLTFQTGLTTEMANILFKIEGVCVILLRRSVAMSYLHGYDEELPQHCVVANPSHPELHAPVMPEEVTDSQMVCNLVTSEWIMRGSSRCTLLDPWRNCKPSGEDDDYKQLN